MRASQFGHFAQPLGEPAINLGAFLYCCNAIYETNIIYPVFDLQRDARLSSSPRRKYAHQDKIGAPALFADNARREGSARMTELDAPFGDGLARLVQGKARRGEATAAQGMIPIMR